jgi:hypothetical protein
LLSTWHGHGKTGCTSGRGPVRFGVSDYSGDAEQQIDTMIRALLQRGIEDGTFRSALDPP